MIALKIISVILGFAFTSFGYLIFFKKKYSLINGFDEDFKNKRKTIDYARCVGLVEFILGVVILVVSVILIIFC